MAFMDFLSNLGSGISGLFGGGGGQQPSYISDPGGLQPLGDYSNLVAAPAAAGGGGFGEWLQNFAGGAKDVVLGEPNAQGVRPRDWLDVAGGALKLGTTGMGIWSNVRNAQLGAEQMKVLRDEQKRLASISAPAAAAGGSLTAAGAAALTGAGPLPAGLEAMVDKFKSDALMRYRQYLADTGQTDSSAALQMEQYVEREAAMYRQQLAEGLLRQGYAGVDTALGPSQSVSQTAGNLVGASMGGANTAQNNIWEILGSV